MSSLASSGWEWLRTGDDVFPAMLAAIDAAQESISLESYIFSDRGPGLRRIVVVIG